MTMDVTAAAPARRPILLRLMAVLLGAIALWLSLSVFDIGFRASNDQRRDFDFALTHTPVQILIENYNGAQAQGRVGHMIVFPLLSFGELVGDLFFYPALCIGMLVAMVWLVGRWGELLTGTRSATAATALFIAFLPVGLNHWLPNAYPTQFLPLALGLLAHVLWLNTARPRVWAICLLAPMTVFAALAFELYLAVLAAMTLVELVVYMARWRRPPGLSGRFLLWQCGLLLAALTLYLAYRLQHPSTYEGNQSAAIYDLGRAMQTFWLHWLDGPSIRLILKQLPDLLIHPLNLIPAAVVAIGLGLIASTVQWTSRGSGALLILGGAAFASASILPLAIVGKYIRWCLDEGHCAYLDNRFSLMGLTLIVAGLLLLVLGSRLGRLALIVLVAIGGALTYLANLDELPNVNALKLAEDRAKHFVCRSPDSANSLPLAQELAALKNPTFYDQVDKVAYWQRYVAHLQSLRPWWFCP